MRSGTLSLSARWIVPVEGEPIRDGVLTIRDGLIAGLGPRRRASGDVLDLGDVAIVPGFVNAHTHLELGPVEPAGVEAAAAEDEVAWLGRVIAQRRGGTAETLRENARRNLERSLAAGTTLLGDVTSGGLTWGVIAPAPVRAVVFAEMIGLRRERAMETGRAALDWYNSLKAGAIIPARARPGLSPHAPYSTAGWIFERAAIARAPLCTHLAEMPEELELLATRRGRLREFLEDLGAWDDAWTPLGPRPTDYLRRGALRRADWLVAHGNYLDASDFWQLRPGPAADDARVAVALCPRTAARFGHLDAHPFRDLLARGMIVCLGTDSLASSPSLSVLDEMRALRRHDPSLGGRLLLTMATLFGAWALRADLITGSLRPGKAADLAVVALPGRDADDPYDLLLDSDRPVVATVFEGSFVHGPWVGA